MNWASFPSPPSNTLELGPLTIHFYGIMIALGVVAGIKLLGNRLVRRGIGSLDDANSIGLWGVLGGVIGSRLYHVATDWSKFSDNLSNIPKIWEGGLGIPGGLLGGVLTAYFVARRRGVSAPSLLDAGAPALPLAQAIGRWGNWFNQELFGRPTTLPWGVQIDPEYRPDEYLDSSAFHPTFLYESLGNLALCGLLLFLDRRFVVARGKLFALYVLGYGVLRFIVEGMRTDPAKDAGGLRLNQWVALAAIAGSLLYLLIARNRPAPVPAIPVEVDEGADPAELDDVPTPEP